MNRKMPALNAGRINGEIRYAGLKLPGEAEGETDAVLEVLVELVG